MYHILCALWGAFVIYILKAFEVEVLGFKFLTYLSLGIPVTAHYIYDVVNEKVRFEPGFFVVLTFMSGPMITIILGSLTASIFWAGYWIFKSMILNSLPTIMMGVTLFGLALILLTFIKRLSNL